MPFVIINLRDPLPHERRPLLAETISATMIYLEINRDTPEIRAIDWTWFRTLGAENWVVGGRFDDRFVKGRAMILAEIIAPAALMDPDLKRKALHETTARLREAMTLSPDDDGIGIFVIIAEVPMTQWSVDGATATTRELIEQVKGDVPRSRLEGIDAHDRGWASVHDTFGIPR